MTTISKRYDDIPFAHRQAHHDGHCSLIHGHNWSFEFTFCLVAGGKLDKNGFIVDFGKLKWLREWLTKVFDHSLVLSREDVECAEALRPWARVVVLPGASCEELVEWVANQVQSQLKQVEPHVTLLRVDLYEDSRNSATHFMPL